MFNFFKDFSELVATFKSIATSIEALVAATKGQKQTVGSAIENTAQALGNVATAIEGAADAVSDVGALAGPPGVAAAAVINGTMPLVGVVAGDVAQEFATPVTATDPMGAALAYFQKGEAVLADMFGNDAEAHVVKAAYGVFTNLLAGHSAKLV